MSEVAIYDCLKFYKKNEKEADVNIDNLFLECIIHNYKITSVIETLQKLVGLRSSFNEIIVNHFGETGILYHGGNATAFGKDLIIYTFYNNSDNRIDTFDYSIDSLGDICTYSVDFKPEKGKLKSMNMLFNNKNIEKLHVCYHSGNGVKDELEMYISIEQLRFYSKGYVKNNPVKELTQSQFAEAINIQRRPSQISRFLNIPLRVLDKMKNIKGFEF